MSQFIRKIFHDLNLWLLAAAGTHHELGQTDIEANKMDLFFIYTNFTLFY